MRRTHLIFGVLLFIVFAITGRYMRVDFPDKEIIPQELRLLMRSRHIYILFNALIHVALGIYLQMRPHRVIRVFQYAGSLTLAVSSGVLLWAFIAETYQYQQFSELIRWGIYTSLAGVTLHLVSGLNPETPASE